MQIKKLFQYISIDRSLGSINRKSCLTFFYLIFQLSPKGMFGNCFFPQFSVFKNNFLFPKAKNLFGNCF